jgi:hypothetical protein
VGGVALSLLFLVVLVPALLRLAHARRRVVEIGAPTSLAPATS